MAENKPVYTLIIPEVDNLEEALSEVEKVIETTEQQKLTF